MKDISTTIEAFLFWKNEPIKIKKISENLNVSEKEIIAGLEKLKNSLKDRGIILMQKNDEVMLGIAPEASALIEKLTKEELSRELSKAALETLSIVLYKGPIRRSEIDFIRGVNSQFIVRHLEIRGLIEKTTSPTDARAFLYRPTFDLLSHLGISKIEDLPEFNTLQKEVGDFVKQSEEENQSNNLEDNELPQP